MASSRNQQAAPETRLRVIFTEDQVQRRVTQMADRVNRDYGNRTLNLVGLLGNSFMFLADFTRLLRVSLVCHFLSIRVKDRTWHGLPLREIVFTPKLPLQGRDVLLVDGVLQTGIPLEFLIDSIREQKPNSLRTAALIEKAGERKVGIKPEYVGFKTSRKFLVGYGLGHEGRYLNLPHIAELKQVGEGLPEGAPIPGAFKR